MAVVAAATCAVILTLTVTKKKGASAPFFTDVENWALGQIPRHQMRFEVRRVQHLATGANG
jgi:hypothetical protein